MATAWAIVSDDFPPQRGGVSTWAWRVAVALHARGDRVEVITRRRPPLAAPFPVHGVWGPHFGRHGGRWVAWAGRRALVRADRILATTWPVATHLCDYSELDVIFHGSDLTRPPVDPRGFERVLAHARLHAVSAFLAGILRSRGVAAAVLPAPVELAAPRPCPEIPRVWGWAGRATPLKGGDRWIRLAAAAGAELRLWGDGPERPAWAHLAKEVGCEAHFFGEVAPEEVLRGLADVDLVGLLPRVYSDGSGAEGLGMVLREAAAAGVPGIGCRVGGVPEAVGSSGLILENPDDVPGSLGAIRAWWSPSLGAAAQAEIASHHGVARLLTQLDVAAK